MNKKINKKCFIIIFNLFCLNFIFSSDMPKNNLWRKTYKECFIQCIKENISKHVCNLHCIHKADEEFYKKQEKENKYE